MFCKECGAQIADGAMFCKECGAPVKVVVEAEKSEPEVKAVPVEPVKKAELEVKTTSFDKVKVEEKLGDAAAVVGAFAKSAGESAKKFGESVKTYANEKAEEAKAKSNAYWSKVADLNGIILTDGEVVIKKYFCTKAIRPEIRGYLAITNKRLVFYGGGGGKSRFVQETPINDVGTITTFYGQTTNMRRALWASLFTILAVAGLGFGIAFGALPLIGVGLLFAAIAYFTWNSCFYETMTFNLSTSKSGYGIAFGDFSGGHEESARLVLTGQAGDDADKMMNELGALIADVQQMGDLAIEKWKE